MYYFPDCRHFLQALFTAPQAVAVHFCRLFNRRARKAISEVGPDNMILADTQGRQLVLPLC